MWKSLTKKRKIGLTLCFLVLFLFVNPYSPVSPFYNLSVGWGGPEGVFYEVYSVQNPNTLINYPIYSGASGYKGADPEASNFPWSTLNVRYDPDNSKNGYPDFYVDVSKIWTENERKDPVDYWVQRQDGSWQHISGFVEVLYSKVVFRAEQSGDADDPTWPTRSGNSEFEVNWRNGVFWFRTGATVWDQAYIDPLVEQKDGRVFAAPLSAFVLSTEAPEESSVYNYLLPDKQSGRQIQFFASPNYGDTSLDPAVTNLDYSVNQDLNVTLQSAWMNVSPDSRLKPEAYFGFEPTDFGVQWWETWPTPWERYINSRSAKIEYTVKWYFLVVGEWIYTQTEYETWVLGNAKIFEKQQFWEAWGNWVGGILTNPLTFLWTFFGIVFLGLTALIVMMLFAPNVFNAIFRRKRGREQ